MRVRKAGTASAATMADSTAMISECSSPPNQVVPTRKAARKMAAMPSIREASRIPRLNRTSTSISRYLTMAYAKESGTRTTGTRESSISGVVGSPPR